MIGSDALSKPKKWQFIWAEDWKVCLVVAIFCGVEIVSVFQIATRFNEFEFGNLMGALAVVIGVVPLITSGFTYFWLKTARLKLCPDCKIEMIRLPRPKSRGEYKQQCPVCNKKVGTGVIADSGSTNADLGKELLRKASAKKDDKEN